MEKKTHKDLIEIANTLGISGNHVSFYEMVDKYIESKSDENTQLTTANVLEVIKSLENQCSDLSKTDENVKFALGFDGKKEYEVVKWCSSINNASGKLKTLSLSELRYVMAEAFRLCKIKKSENERNFHKSENNRNNQNGAKDRNIQKNEKNRNWKNNNNYDRKYMQTESKTKTKEKDYLCSKCKAKLDLSEIQKASLREGKVLNGIICPKCKKKNQVRP